MRRDELYCVEGGREWCNGEKVWEGGLGLYYECYRKSILWKILKGF